jgi:hypothetical protein
VPGRQHEHQGHAEQVRADHDPQWGPPVNQGSGDRGQQQDGKYLRDDDTGDAETRTGQVIDEQSERNEAQTTCHYTLAQMVLPFTNGTGGPL